METVATTTYTVQMAQGSRPASGLGSGATNMETWADVATVTVPRKSPRKTVIHRALAEAGVTPRPDSEPLRVRVLDAASAAETTVEPFQPDPEWKVGS